MFAAGERRGAGKAEQVVREGVEPQRRLKRIRQLLFGDRLDDQREADLLPQERPAARRSASLRTPRPCPRMPACSRSARAAGRSCGGRTASL